MRVFLDANILISVLNKEYPLFPYTARLLSLTRYSQFSLITSPVCLAIAFYFAEKKHGTTMARNKIALLLEHIKIANCGEKETKMAIQNKQAHDFEDALQYYCALHAGCEHIITNDLNDFYFAQIEVLTPEAFLMRYVTR
ncbi:PIN domain-containing protein [Agriterribacter sp.]|uniref:type II toxin-antitoxin system VapC family toxin n=1 Tax=Agriterribacter sp. TaxID=2821509 RepID=UPI002B962C25|nr:PIN domain-containing protein [Agriterribacter sp.]HRO47798.1 PIN domain-containing protein [Agriterribacter sp.]HRQ18916.1 PIN domain-containing protein [Agriterribacter sp.]